MESGLKLPIFIEQQQASMLCWAAVAVTISKYYEPDKPISQQALATTIHGKENNNHVYSPQISLGLTGNFRAILERPLSVEEIWDEINSGNPIVACMRYFIGWHVVIIYGISASNNLNIADPLHGDLIFESEEFIGKYLDDYYWSHSILTQRNNC